METDPSFRSRLYQGQHLLGFSLSYPSPGVVECIGTGWDWVWIDGQHGQYDYRGVIDCVRAADAKGLASIIRTPGHEYGVIGPMLDTAATGLMIPLVNTAEEARQVVRSTRFPPAGNRSFGGRRPIDMYTRDYLQKANDEFTLVVQIETPEALANAEAIAAVDGVDALFFGPDDYKLRRDIPMHLGLLDSDELLRATDAIGRAARNAGKAAGTIAATPDLLQRVLAAGYRINSGGGDEPFLRMGSRLRLSELRAVPGA